MNYPRIIIAGTNSGCGKTTVTAGLMASLVKRGVRVQPFKAGPDYIDPMFHTFVTGRYSRNIDSWLLGEKTLMHLFSKNSTGCDISVIEGVMGLYDGFGGNSIEGSTAHISRILKCPVILVVNAKGMSLSAAAMVKGFKDFKGGADVRGVILNKIESHALYIFLKDIIEENTGVRVLGYIPQSEDYILPERYLGLVPEGEMQDLKDRLDRLAEAAGKTIDLELLMKMAKDAPELKGIPEIYELAGASESKPEMLSGLSGFVHKKPPAKARIAVAMDSAFNFYYRDNLELLETLGAKLVYFSPLNDDKLPEGINGVYFGGGYPEIFAKELFYNCSMRQDVREKLINGLPAYAECGGFMYLCRTLKDIEGNVFDMAGVFPAQCEMTTKLQRFGYVNVNIVEKCILGEPGHKTRAHEFHYSVANMDENSEIPGLCSCYEVLKQKKEGESLMWKDGWKIKNTLGGYPHIHFWSNPGFAAKFIESCAQSKEVMRF